MISFRKAFQIALVFALTGALWVAVPPQRAAAGTTILVNTTDNILGDGLCSLQEAVQAANTDNPTDSGACLGGSGTDTITFNIGASGSTQTITLSTTLEISAPVFIDGTTQPGYNFIARVPLIEITGSSWQLIRLTAGSGGSSIGGLRLTSTYGSAFGYVLTLETDGNLVVGNYIGTDGTQVANSYALGVYIGTSNNTVGGTTPADRNLFGGGQGVIIGSGSGNVIEGNYFGVQADGVTPLGGIVLRGDGITLVTGSATSNTIRGNVITGYMRGVLLRSGAILNTVAGNLIGLGADGTTVLGNAEGVRLWGGASNVIGGTSAADRNVISGNTSANIQILNEGLNTAKDNLIQGNYIGTTADGLSAARPGTGYGEGYGIYMSSGATNTIGGTAAGSGNVISGNATGIYIEASVPGTIIRGNFIGTNASGTSAVPSGIGVSTYSDVNIGDAGTPGNNVISGNTEWYGILIHNATTATIYGNRIGLRADGAGAIPNEVGMDIYGTATVAENWIGFNTNQGLNVEATGNLNSGSLDNCFTFNANVGASNSHTAVPQPLTNNWWRSSTGPTHGGNPTGKGDKVSNYVSYSPWLPSAPSACPTVVGVTIAGTVRSAHPKTPGSGERVSYSAINDGPVRIMATNGLPIIAAERVILSPSGSRTSFTEMMGLPDAQLDTTYWMPWYNNVELDTQLRFGNVSGSAASVHVYIHEAEMPGSPFPLGVGESTRVSFAGINDGPVKIESNVPIVAAERVIFSPYGSRTSFTEMMGLPDAQLDTTYWMPWYNNVDLDTQLRFGNVSGSPASVHVYIHGAEMPDSPFALGVGESTRVSFAGINDGPVEISSNVPIVAAERVIFSPYGSRTSFTEMMGLPAGQLDTAYWMPWYNNVDLDTQLRFGNVSGSPASVHVYIHGAEMPGSPFGLAVGESTRVSFAGINDGPVQVQSDVNIVAAERVIFSPYGLRTSFSEMMGLPAGELDTAYWLPWYNNVELDTQVRFGMP